MPHISGAGCRIVNSSKSTFMQGARQKCGVMLFSTDGTLFSTVAPALAHAGFMPPSADCRDTNVLLYLRLGLLSNTVHAVPQPRRAAVVR